MDTKNAVQRLAYIKWLIDKKATGSPKEMASKLQVSERTVYRLLDDVKIIYKINISYSAHFNSYIVWKPSINGHSSDQIASKL